MSVRVVGASLAGMEQHVELVNILVAYSEWLDRNVGPTDITPHEELVARFLAEYDEGLRRQN